MKFRGCLRRTWMGSCIWYIYIYASPPPQDQYFESLADVHVSENCFPCWCGGVTGIQKIFWLLGRCSCVRPLFSMLMWKGCRNSEDKLSLQGAFTRSLCALVMLRPVRVETISFHHMVVAARDVCLLVMLRRVCMQKASFHWTCVAALNVG